MDATLDHIACATYCLLLILLIQIRHFFFGEGAYIVMSFQSDTGSVENYGGNTALGVLVLIACAMYC